MRPEAIIGEKLKNIRLIKRLTLDDVSAQCGVSKPMLLQIEKGRSSPTVNTLWKIATGLKIPLSVFFDERAEEYTLSDVSDKEAVYTADGKMNARALFSYDPTRSFEIFMIELEPGCVHESEKHDVGVEEYLLVISGGLCLTLNSKSITLDGSRAMRFRADVPHAYSNPFREPCSAYNIIVYPNKYL